MTATLIYILIPMAATVVGAAIAAYRPPSAVLLSGLQHFAAGVVFAAVATEVLPNMKHGGSPWPVIIGGGVGIAVMLLIREIGNRVSGAIALITLVGVDILIDGLVLGLGFSAGEKAGLLLTVALTLEVLFLGLALSAEIGEGKIKPGRIIAITAGLVLLLPLGALIASPVAALPRTAVVGFFAFGLIALLYLVTEELLVEAHETKDRPWVTALKPVCTKSERRGSEWKSG